MGRAPKIERSHRRTERTIRAEVDLRWYWNEAEGELTRPSNYGWMVFCLEHGTSGLTFLAQDDLSDALLASARRERTLRRRLDALGARHREILHRMLGPVSTPPLPAFGRFTPLIPLVPTSRIRWMETRAREPFEVWLVLLAAAARSLDIAAQREVGAILRDAERLYDEALTAFEETDHGA